MARVALLAARPLTFPAGNTISVVRIARSLAALGTEAHMLSLGDSGIEAALSDLRTARVDLLHAFHAANAAPRALQIARRLDLPLAVTITGTDLSVDAHSADVRPAMEAALRAAGAVMVPNETSARAVEEDFGIDGGRIVLVPKGVTVPVTSEAETAPSAGGEVRFLLPAGWRDVKNNLFPLRPLEEVARRVPCVRLKFVGPVLDAAYRAGFDPARFPFAADGGSVPPERMSDEYRAAAVVLNVSHAEGGSNAVLEAMAWACPVLAADIAGNRAFIDFDPDRLAEAQGILYPTAPAADPRRRLHDANMFRDWALRLALDPTLRAELGRRARAAAENRHSPAAEAEAVLSAYRLCGLVPGRPVRVESR